MAKNTICVWYDRDAEAAAHFYANTFPDSRVGAVTRAPIDNPGNKKSDVLLYLAPKIFGINQQVQQPRKRL